MLAICIKEGFYVENKMAFGCRNEAVGDRGNSKGAFQIHSIHGVPDRDRRNFDFSARWTAERLIRKGYRKNSLFWRKNAITLHNGDSDFSRRYSRSVLIASDQVRVAFD